MPKVAISLGSNLGDRRRHLTMARRALADLGQVVAVSPVYRTAPVGVDGHPEYLNAVAVLETDLAPQQVMRGLLSIERTGGRERRAEGVLPRPIDLDLLLYDDQTVRSEGLVVPHPRMMERRFVLEPLHDVWPDAPLPGGVPMAEAMAGVSHQALAPADRGGGWVVVQAFLAAALIAAAIWDRGTSGLSGTWFEWVGRGLVVAGAVQALLGLRWLGSQLTAFPEPLHRGTLVEHGVYRYVRHPLYGANVLLISGVALHQNSAWAMVVAGVSWVFYAVKATAEERRLAFRYPEYEAYRTRVRFRLIPGLY